MFWTFNGGLKQLPSWFVKQYQEGGWNNFNGADIYVLLCFNIDYNFHLFLDLTKLDNDEIADVISHKPELHSYFDLDALPGYNIAHILSFQPQLYNLFDLDELDEDDKEFIIEFAPQLYNIIFPRKK